MTAVLRFAPSPNGFLHLGHALSALTGVRWARRLGGRFLLRIEDIDTRRCPQTYIDAMLEDLAWLGIAWEQPVLRQSEHFPVYTSAARRLEDMGLLYPCFATRSDIEAAVAARAALTGMRDVDPDGAPLYPGLYRSYPPQLAADRRARGELFAMRIDIEKALAMVHQMLDGRPLTFNEIDDAGRVSQVSAQPRRWGDAVIVRKDTPTSYHLSVVVDDARQAITHVTRGRDLYAATDLHRLLQVLLELGDWRIGPRYHHHRLITTEDGRKLAKSACDTSLRTARSEGWSVNDVYCAVGVSSRVEDLQQSLSISTKP